MNEEEHERMKIKNGDFAPDRDRHRNCRLLLRTDATNCPRRCHYVYMQWTFEVW
jgi:hypothetical protein